MSDDVLKRARILDRLSELPKAERKVPGSWNLILLLLLPCHVLAWGWSFARIWSWFIVPVFRLPALGIAGALGLRLVVGAATFRFPPLDYAKETQTPRGLFLRQAMAPWVEVGCLLIAGVVLHWLAGVLP